jgi:uncharacterized protein DUF3800
MDSKFYIFSDESGQDGSNRYGSLATVSGSSVNTEALNKELNKILSSYNKKEIKFKKVKNQNSKSIASQFIDKSFEYIKRGKIKVHVLVWDKQDSRHSIQDRCDIENLKRMYYKILKNVKTDWNTEVDWRFYPDEFTAIEWREDIVKYLENTPLNKVMAEHPTLFKTFYIPHFAKYTVVKELESDKYPILQLADLYAGIVRTSRTEISFYHWFKEQDYTKPNLFNIEVKTSISNSMRPKYEVMKYFKEKSGIHRLGINLSKHQYFTTFNRRNNICIMHYEPQHELDKAPTRKK